MNDAEIAGGEPPLTHWLKEARRGNKDAFEHLYTTDSWQRWVTAIACQLPRRLRSKVDPEDILMETLKQASRDIAELKEVSTEGFHRWIAGIARRRAIDVIKYHDAAKRSARREERFRDSVHGGVAGQEPTPSKCVARREQWSKIAGVLDELKDSHRAVVVYRVLEGYTTEDVAAMTGKSPTNVSVTLHRALARLRELLKKQGIESTVFRSS